MHAAASEDGDVITIKKDASAIGKMVKDDIKSEFSGYWRFVLVVLFISCIEIIAIPIMSYFSKFDMNLVGILVIILCNAVLISRIRKVQDDFEQYKKDFGEN